METPRKEQGKGGKGSVTNISPDESRTKDQQEVGDGVKQALEEVMATMHSISSKAEENSLELCVIPKAEVELEGEPVRKLLDTGSPVTIVSLEFLLQVWAWKKLQGQSPTEWKAQVERRLEPTPLALRNYGGGRLPVVRQVQTTISRPGYKVEETIQVQRGAPARLLVGTELLPRLGFLFVCTGEGSEVTDLLESQVLSGNLGNGSRCVADRDQRIQCACCELLDCLDSIHCSHIREQWCVIFL